jgi:acetoin utilization deacetylase AcuC-like enzyme
MTQPPQPDNPPVADPVQPLTDPAPGRPVYWHYDHFQLPLPARHRYPRQKYQLVRELLVGEGTISPARMIAATPVDWSVLALLHTAPYLAALRNNALSRDAERELGLPFTPLLADRARAAVQATVQGARRALVEGIAVNLGGGNHHSFPERPSGYCLLNDIAVAVRVLQQARLVERVALIDLDVHQGNANAEIFRHDRGVLTLSVHGARNWPYRKAESDIDIALPDLTGDADYLAALADPLEQVFTHFRPDIVFYQAGVDPLTQDRLGRLALTHAGLRARDALVIGHCRQAHCPLVITMGGGYGQPIEATVEAHANTFRELEAQWGP